MSDAPYPSLPEGPSEEPLLDSILREAVPEIKLALGDLIDRDNARAIPDRYAKLLPETVLAVTLRPDAAEAVSPVAVELERELTESCNRHGSLYDRVYRVQLRRAGAPGAPLFRVSVSSGKEPEATGITPAAGTAQDPRTEAAPARDAEATQAAPPPPPPPAMDPDATRVEGLAPPPAPGPGRFVLVVEDEDGTEQERFPLSAPVTTVGRRTDDPSLRADLMLAGAAHVSRRQAALAWDPRGGEPGFRVVNLGLNPLHAGDRDVPGANLGKGPLNLESVDEKHGVRVAPGEAVRIGEHGPVLRVVDAGEALPPVDPDATQLG